MPTTPATVTEAAPDAAATNGAAAPPAPPGDPAILGLPIFVVGSIALGLVNVGYVPPRASAAALPIILAATGLGLLVATVWAAALGQTLVAGIFGLFAGFWWSYGALVLGLSHAWFAIPIINVQRTVALFLISWAIVMGLLAIGSVRLPVSYTGVVVLVVAALVLLIFGTLGPNANLVKAAGWVTFAFAALGAYLFLNTAWTATGGKPLPLGPPLVK